MGAKNPIVMADPDEVEKCWDKGKKDDEVKEEKTENSPLHKPGGPNSQYNKDGTKKKPAPGKNADGTRYNPYGENSNMNPTRASQTTGP